MIPSLYAPFLTKPELELPFYAATIGNPRFQTPVLRESGIEHFQLLYTVSGCGECKIDGETLKLTSGELYILPPRNEHRYAAVGDEWETLYITCGGSGFGGFFALEPTVVRLPDDFRFVERWSLLDRLKRSGGASVELSVELYRLLAELRGLVAGKRNRSRRLQIEPLVAAMNENLTLSISELADRAGVSAEYFCRRFREYMGCRPLEYLNRLRLQRAKNLLDSTSLAISEIAVSVGISDHSYFTKSFRRTFGCPPSEYRRTSSKSIKKIQ